MQIVRSKDGTEIAFSVDGEGSPVILVLGAFNDHMSGKPLVAALSTSHTVINYDRRGRGGSGDTAPYTTEREVDDLAALVEAAGGSAAVFGHSSGALLALKAAAAGLPITHLALYEPPLRLEVGWPAKAQALRERLTALVTSGRRGEAVELFQGEVVGMPPEAILQARHAPFRPGLEAMAQTLPYELALMADPEWQQETIECAAPTLLIVGEDSPPFMHEASAALAKRVTGARQVVLEGQSHHIDPAATAAALIPWLE